MLLVLQAKAGARERLRSLRWRPLHGRWTSLRARQHTRVPPRQSVYGLEARGAPDDDAFNRETGQGRVHEKKGDYSDALSKGSVVHLMAIESSGGMNDPLIKTLKALDKLSRSPDGHDTTEYGDARHSTTSFFQYHASALSLAVQLAVTRTGALHSQSSCCPVLPRQHCTC